MLKFDGLFLFDQLRLKQVDFSFRRTNVDEAFDALRAAFPKSGVVLDEHKTGRKIRNFVQNGFLSVGQTDGFEQVLSLKEDEWFFFAVPSKTYHSKVAYRLLSR